MQLVALELIGFNSLIAGRPSGASRSLRPFPRTMTTPLRVSMSRSFSPTSSLTRMPVLYKRFENGAIAQACFTVEAGASSKVSRSSVSSTWGSLRPCFGARKHRQDCDRDVRLPAGRCPRPAGRQRSEPDCWRQARRLGRRQRPATCGHQGGADVQVLAPAHQATGSRRSSSWR